MLKGLLIEPARWGRLASGIGGGETRGGILLTETAL
jgi:hypothetical protein